MTNGTSALTLVKNDDSLMTIEQMAVREGITPDAMRKRIVKAGIMPVKEVERGHDGSSPALYNFAKIQQVFLQNSVKELTVEQQMQATTDWVETLDAEQTYKIALQLQAVALKKLDDNMKSMAAEKNKLQIELDQAKEWYSVKRVLKETGEEYDWRPLKKYSIANGYDMPKVFDKNYGNVNAYHIEVWHDVYGLEL